MTDLFELCDELERIEFALIAEAHGNVLKTNDGMYVCRCYAEFESISVMAHESLGRHKSDCTFRIIAEAALAHVAEVPKLAKQLQEMAAELRKGRRTETFYVDGLDRNTLMLRREQDNRFFVPVQVSFDEPETGGSDG